MLLQWTCTACQRVEVFDFEYGGFSETIEKAKELGEEYLCADCEELDRVERVNSAYSLD